jgi:hypothetical protein
MHHSRILITGLMAAMLWPAASAWTCPTEPSDSWVYAYLDELRLREKDPTRLFVSTGPYGRLETAAWLAEQPQPESGTRSAWLHRMLEIEFKDEDSILSAGSGWAGSVLLDARTETDARVAGEILGRLAYYAPIGVCFWSSIRTSVNGEQFHKVDTHTWGDRARASVDYAGFAFHRSGFSIALARDEVSWGTDRRVGLLFSGAAPVLDMLSVAYRRGPLAFTAFHSRLRRWPGEETEDDIRRYVAAHRLEFLPNPKISFAVSEAVVYGGRDRSFEPGYLNPLIIFYASQWNSGQNDNILFSGDFSVLIPRVVEIKGEVMVDDFQYDFGTEPHEFAAGARVAAVNPLRPGTSLLGASYYHVRNQTYGHFVAWNRFVNEGRVMGYPDGPDGDRVDAWLSLAVPETMLWRLDFGMKRRGEGRATDDQDPTGPRVKFPSGTVEATRWAGLELAWRAASPLVISGRGAFSHTSNLENREGADESGWDVSVNIRYDLKLTTWLGG